MHFYIVRGVAQVHDLFFDSFRPASKRIGTSESAEPGYPAIFHLKFHLPDFQIIGPKK